MIKKFETVVKTLAQMKASSILGGGYGGISTEIAIVAMIYGKQVKAVEQAIEAVYPKIYEKMAG